MKRIIFTLALILAPMIAFADSRGATYDERFLHRINQTVELLHKGEISPSQCKLKIKELQQLHNVSVEREKEKTLCSRKIYCKARTNPCNESVSKFVLHLLT